jgi:hypothetical protein
MKVIIRLPVFLKEEESNLLKVNIKEKRRTRKEKDNIVHLKTEKNQKNVVTLKIDQDKNTKSIKNIDGQMIVVTVDDLNI